MISNREDGQTILRRMLKVAGNEGSTMQKTAWLEDLWNDHEKEERELKKSITSQGLIEFG